jgi:hypothetical protein
MKDVVLRRIVLGISLAVGAPVAAHAACTSPAGGAGKLIYSSTYKVLQYCNGTGWVNLGNSNQGGGSGPCSNPAGPEGKIIYNGSTNVLEYCNGDSWVNMGNSNAGATGSCAVPTASRGAMIFSTTANKLQYCNGTSWINAGNWVAASPAPACTGSYTWTAQTAAGSRGWSQVASSSDGTKLAANITLSGYIYTSTDSGVTWTTQTGSGARDWYVIVSSADGTKLAAAGSYGSYI